MSTTVPERIMCPTCGHPINAHVWMPRRWHGQCDQCRCQEAPDSIARALLEGARITTPLARS